MTFRISFSTFAEKQVEILFRIVWNLKNTEDREASSICHPPSVTTDCLPVFLALPAFLSATFYSFQRINLVLFFSRSLPVFLCFSTILWLLTESFPSSHIWVICCWYLEIWLVLDADATCCPRAELIHRPMVLAEFPGSVVQNTSSCYVQIDTVLFSFQSLSLLFCFLLWPSAWVKLIVQCWLEAAEENPLILSLVFGGALISCH